MSASNFLLDDMVYANVRTGWNEKLKSSSQKLSGLVPFVELYAVFKNSDVIFSNPHRFSEVASRAIDVKFQYTIGSKVRPDGSNYGGKGISSNNFAERFDIAPESKIVPIASSGKSQTEPDSITGPSYRGYAGINDLAVSRGASGPMNIKYDLNITLPNPELINEMYEYSKIMILNSAFLLVYGWNPHEFDYDTGPVPPPRIVPGVPAEQNNIELNSSNGGFYKSSLVKLYRFSFGLDNVGHLSGKISFLTLAGNFLVSTRAEAISAHTKKQLNGYSGMLYTVTPDYNAGSPDPAGESLAERGQFKSDSADAYIAAGELFLEESEAYLNEWNKSIEKRSAGDYSWGERSLPPTNAEKGRKRIFSGEDIVDGINAPVGYSEDPNPLSWEPWDWPKDGRFDQYGPGATPDDGIPHFKWTTGDATYALSINAVPSSVDADLFMKTVLYAKWLIEKHKKEKLEVLGFMDIENGLPWAMPSLLKKAHPALTEDLTILDTMPAYGKDLMTNIWKEFRRPGNPNRGFFFPINPDDPNANTSLSIAQLGKRMVPAGLGSDPARGHLDADYFLDPETVKILKSSCAISTMLLEVAPEEETSEERDDSWWQTGAGASVSDAISLITAGRIDLALDEATTEKLRRETLGLGEGGVEINKTMNDVLEKLSIYEVSTAGLDNKSGTEEEREDDLDAPMRLITHSKPVYYFLGAVLEALKRSMGNVISFVYPDIPLEGEIFPGGFSLPLPQANKSAVEAAQAEIDKIQTELTEWNDLVRKAVALPDGDEKEAALPKNANLEDLIEKGSYQVASGRTRVPIRVNKWDVPVPSGREGEPMNLAEINAEREARIKKSSELVKQANIVLKRSQDVLTPIQCKNVFELPVDISAVRQILNEANAPLHNLINKILKACDKTTKTIRLSTRPYAADETYLEIFVANIRVDGVTREVLNDLDIQGFLASSDIRANVTQEQLRIARAVAAPGSEYTASDIAAARTHALSTYFSEKAIVCEFGTERSLVESFSLSSKVDPNAFTSFRLPEVIGGQSIDIAGLIRGNVADESMGLMNDMRGILEKGMFSGKQQLLDLKIITLDRKNKVQVNNQNLKQFLLTDTHAASKVQSTFISNLMASNQDFNTKVMSLQNEGITGSGGRGNTPANNAFYGGVLSSYLRTISVTIHGTVGLGMFNVVYIKGLMRGIEGLYLITSVNESVTPSTFSTSLECKLIQYKDTSANNPLAENLNITLQAAAETAKGEEFTTYEALFDQTEQNLVTDKNKGILIE